MADLTKLTNLGHLQDLAERINADFATKKELTTLSEKVEGLVTAGGEPNKIEKIKVNGTEQTIGADKSVDIKVPTKVSELTNDQQYQTNSQVASAIQQAIAATGHAVFEKAESIPVASAAKPNVLYLVMNSKTKHYDIYALVGETVELLDDTTVDLTAYSTTEQINTLLGGYVKKDGSKVLSTNDYTTAEKQKLACLNNYTHPASAAGAKTSGLYKITTDANGHVIAATPVAKSDITDLGIPGQDTKYNPATSSVNGLMSSTDKAKLDGIEIATDEEVEEMLNEVFTAA